METVNRRGEQNGKRAKRRRRVRRKKGIRIALYIVLTVWGVLGLIGILTVAQWVLAAPQSPGQARGIKWSPVSAEADRSSSENGGGEAGEEEKKTRRALTEEERESCRQLYDENPGLLVIANKERALPQDYDPGLRYICNGRLQAASVMYDDLVEMLSAAEDAGYEFWIASGFRSRKRQQELVDEDVRTFMRDGLSYDDALEKVLEETMPAGHSEHETGLSLDILCSGNMEMDASQAEEPGNRWLAEHCSEFGFILRYPADKADVTGIAFEPWHFRYVGRDAAAFMAETGITLEEFWENL